MKIKRFAQQLFSSSLVLASRFIGLPANFSPIGSYGFFGKNAFFFFAIIIIHDHLKGGFYPGFWLTYIGFALYIVLGKLAGENMKKRLFFLPIASLLFFLFSNLGVWWYWYPHSLQSLFTCYLVALPFYRNTFLGDVIFGYGILALQSLRKHSVQFSFFKTASTA